MLVSDVNIAKTLLENMQGFENVTCVVNGERIEYGQPACWSANFKVEYNGKKYGFTINKDAVMYQFEASSHNVKSINRKKIDGLDNKAIEKLRNSFIGLFTAIDESIAFKKRSVENERTKRDNLKKNREALEELNLKYCGKELNKYMNSVHVKNGSVEASAFKDKFQVKGTVNADKMKRILAILAE